MLTFGLLVNPIAGVGGRAALKGSDGADIQALARTRGGSPRGAARALRALEAAGDATARVRWLAWGGAMGAEVLESLGLQAAILGHPADPPTAADTRAAATAMVAAGADLILFCGGDGTARDLLDAVDRQVPVLGIPAGVKMHSGVFATTPRAAGEILRALVEGGLVRRTVAEVRDLDEAALRQGVVKARFYGELAVPELGAFLQHTKEGGRENEALALEEIVADVAEQVHGRSGIYLLGPGSSMAAIKRALGMQATLIGVDVFAHGQQAASDVDAAWLEAYLAAADEPVTLIVSFTRQQGFLLGRGNQQLSPAVLRRVGRDNLWVVGTRTKLLGLEGRPLLLDTDDVELDRAWSGLIEVVTGYEDRMLYRLDGGPADTGPTGAGLDGAGTPDY
jgi:predicted polyphosphate/ATP-dependent NAD kinase